MEKIYATQEDLTKEYIQLECPDCGVDFILNEDDIDELINHQSIIINCSYCGKEIEVMLS